ncbi:MAG: hypothetical protein KF729_05985 [Sandaracinaceae bacterium]|nr:hypothetical protein [Sandaracinaceae bacterium]
MGEPLDLMRSSRLAAVVSSPDRDDLIARALAAAKGGIQLLALPISVPFVAEIAAEVADAADVTVGLSDVVLSDHLNVALAAGAEFVISPIFDPELIETARARGIDVLPSVATPNELRSATRTLEGPIAISPASGLGGPEYVAWLARAFGVRDLVAMGGIGSDSAPQYLERGAIAVVVDKGLFPDEPDPEANAIISVRAEALVELCASVIV